MEKVTMQTIKDMILYAHENEKMVSVIFKDKCANNTVEILSEIDIVQIEPEHFGFYANESYIELSCFDAIFYDKENDCYLLEDKCVKLHVAIF